MKTLVISISLILNLILSGSLGYLIYKENKYQPPTDSQYSTFTDTIKFSSAFVTEKKLSEEYFATASKPVKDIKMNAWIPSWAVDEGLKSLESKKTLFDTVNPVYYEMNADGTLNVNKKGLEDLKKIVAGTKTKIVPTISGFDADAFSIILNDKDKFDRHLKFLLNEVEENKFDGIDLDYESIYLKDKTKFFDLVKALSVDLKSKGKILSITVLSKWGDNIEYGFAPETRQVQDYAELSKYADQFRIMTYDYTSASGTKSGPIAPIEWMDQVLDYAVKRVPKEKLILGIHLYGYAWPNGEAAVALDYRQIAELKLENKTTQFLENNIDKESAVRFDENGKSYFGYYSSQDVIKSRIELAAKYGINGVAYWRLGDDPL